MNKILLNNKYHQLLILYIFIIFLYFTPNAINLSMIFNPICIFTTLPQYWIPFLVSYIQSLFFPKSQNPKNHQREMDEKKRRNAKRRPRRWKSEAYQSYIRLDNEFYANLPFRALISPIDSSLGFGIQ